jgi:hypothetical protein
LIGYAVISMMTKSCPGRSKYQATDEATSVAEQTNRMDNKIIPKPQYDLTI